MSLVFGNVNLLVSIPAESQLEELAILQANYRLHPELIVKYELFATNCHGERFRVDVHDSDNIVFDDFVEV